MNKAKLKIIMIMCIVFVGAGSFYLISRPKQTEAEILGKEVFKQHIYLGKEESKALYNITAEYVKSYEQAQGNKEKEEKAAEDRKEAEDEFYEKIYYQNIERFKRYQLELKELISLKKVDIENDKNLFREYVLFNTHVQNKRFNLAVNNLLIIEGQANIKIME